VDHRPAHRRRPTVNAIILKSVSAVFLAVAGYALWMRRHRPDAYALIPTTTVATEDLGAANAVQADLADPDRV